MQFVVLCFTHRSFVQRSKPTRLGQRVLKIHVHCVFDAPSHVDTTASASDNVFTRKRAVIVFLHTALLLAYI